MTERKVITFSMLSIIESIENLINLIKLFEFVQCSQFIDITMVVKVTNACVIAYYKYDIELKQTALQYMLIIRRQVNRST